MEAEGIFSNFSTKYGNRVNSRKFTLQSMGIQKKM